MARTEAQPARRGAAQRAYEIAAAAALPYAFWRAARRGDLASWREYLARDIPHAPSNSPRPLWVHAVSVGEAAAAVTFLKCITAEFPEARLLLTHTTAAGRARLQQAAQFAAPGGGADVARLPFDVRFVMRRFLAAHRPRALILMEAEIWPALIFAAAEAGVPVMMANARMSARAARRYARASALFAPLFAQLSAAAAQGAEDARRFRALGAQNAAACGNMKFDAPIPSNAKDIGAALRAQWDENADTPFNTAPVVFFAATRSGEERALLDAAGAEFLRAHRIIIAPRHQQRGDKVAALLKRRGIFHHRRSRNQQPAGGVYLADTTGEMAALYAAADVAVVGGSFLPQHGGQSPIEAFLTGRAVVMGPHLRNLGAVARGARRAGAMVFADGAEDAIRYAAQLAASPAARAILAAAATEFCEQNKGASARALNILRAGLIHNS